VTASLSPRADSTGARDDIVIRRAVADDAPRLAEFARRTFVETFGPDNTPEDMALHVAKAFGPAIQLGEIRDDDVVTLLAELDTTLAGFAQVRRAPPPDCVTGPLPVELLRFYVDRPFHGRGIAPSLMRAVEQVARDLGGRTLWLGVWERNPRAIAFYTKCGFVDVGAHAFFFGTEEQSDRVMAHPL
jgi:ribosomal protein S18 acetylase RimI-like enzyme